MQDDPYDLSHVIDVGIAPPRQSETGFLESFIKGVSTSYNQSTSVDGDYGFAIDLFDAIAENDDKIAKLVPGYKRDIGVTPEEINAYASQFTDAALPTGFLGESGKRAAIAKFEKYNARLEELRQAFPGQIATTAEIFERVKADRARYIQEAQNAREAGGISAIVGGFFGSLGGTLDARRNPVQFGTLFAGGVGKKIATRIATEGAVFAGAAVARDTLFVNPTREAFGEEQANVFEDALYAGLLGVAGRGVIEGIGPAFRAVETKVAPGRAFARALEQDVKNFRADFNLETPSGRAGAAIYEHDEALRAANPYENTDEGVARFLRELDHLDNEFTTSEPAPAIPREPADIRSAVEDRSLLEAEAPEVFSRLTETEAKLDALTQSSNNLANSIDNRTVGDIAATFLDEDTANLISSLESDLNNVQATRQVRAAAEKQLNTIIETIGVERFIKAGEDSAIKPRYELRAARKSEKIARAEFNAAAHEAFDEIDKIKARKEATLLVEREASVKKAQQLATTAEQPTITLTSEVASVAVKQAEELSVEIPKLVEREVEKVKATLADVAAKTYELPNGETVDLDFRIELEDGSMASVREILIDLDEDDKLVAAMGSCLI